MSNKQSAGMRVLVLNPNEGEIIVNNNMCARRGQLNTRIPAHVDVELLMNTEEIGLVDRPPKGPLDDMLSAAWAVRPLSAADVSKLAWTKRWYRASSVGLTDDELQWLTRLAKRGGWKPAGHREAAHA